MAFLVRVVIYIFMAAKRRLLDKAVRAFVSISHKTAARREYLKKEF
jgi:hypothetical protein